MAGKKDTRNMKVYCSYGYKDREIPMIILKGEWLEELGFENGDTISVKCEEGKITIVPREPEKQVIRTIIETNGVSRVAEERIVYK